MCTEVVQVEGNEPLSLHRYTSWNRGLSSCQDVVKSERHLCRHADSIAGESQLIGQLMKMHYQLFSMIALNQILLNNIKLATS